MRFHKTTEYAIRVLKYIAENRSKPQSATILHYALDIPYKYLGHLLTELKKAGFLKSVFGKNGGYTLTKLPERVNLAEIIRYCEGDTIFENCILREEPCDLSNQCILHKHWDPIRTTMTIKLSKLRLSDLIESKENILEF